MKRCLITYDSCEGGDYSVRGLKKLSPRLERLERFPYSEEEQVKQASLRMRKMSVQGVQPKLSAVLKVSDGCFEIVDSGGRYIIKPQNPSFSELPENEDLTMHMAAVAGIEVPLHGLIRCKDGGLSYFIKRFDRTGRKGKVALEDFAQLAGCSRDTKYKYSLEKLIAILDNCTFPKVARAELFKRVLFNFMVGNEDMHLKNYSLIIRNNKVELAPAYDFLNSTIVYRNLGRPWSEIEESALPLAGRKRRFTSSILLEYFGCERLGLPAKQVQKIKGSLLDKVPEWQGLIDISFLSEKMKELYRELLAMRVEVFKH